jgi:hypothetical protein
VRLVAPGATDAKSAAFAAVVRGAAEDRRLALSTADASRLIPIVAIAPKAQLDANEPKMRELARAWLDGLGRAGKDASTVARRLANKEALPLAAGVGGAPELIALLDRLGQFEAATLAQQSSWIGAGAKGSVTLTTLTQRTWTLARGGGLTTGAAPDPLPIDARIVTAIAPPPSAASHPADGDAGADAGAGAFAPLPAGSTPLVVYRVTDAQSDPAQPAVGPSRTHSHGARPQPRHAARDRGAGRGAPHAPRAAAGRLVTHGGSCGARAVPRAPRATSTRGVRRGAGRRRDAPVSNR